MPTFLLGIDIGTTACKTALFDETGQPIAKASNEYSVEYPRLDWAEQDPDVWWNAVRSNIRSVLRRVNDRRAIVGVGVDSQREAVVPIDSRGRRLGKSLIWLDRRTIPQTHEMARHLSRHDVIQTTGLPIDYFYSAPKILWFRDERPSLFRKTACFLFPKDYVIFRLTGQKYTDCSMASRTMLFDIRRRKWSDPICEALDINQDLLPPVAGSSEVVGEVTSEAGKSTGLPVGTPVVAGGGDRPCESLGAGAIHPDQFNIGTGTATVMTTPLSKPKVDTTGHIDCCCHVIPNIWEYEITILTTGASLRWFGDNFAAREIGEDEMNRSGANPYAYLDRLAGEAEPGCNGLFFYPYPMGAKVPKFNDNARAVFFGITLAHTKAHFVRAIFEGIAFQYAEAMTLARKLGIDAKEALIVGGEARSDLWNQIKADVLARPIKRPAVEEAAALGSALLASVGTGVHRTIEEGARKMVKVKKTYRPGQKATRDYHICHTKYEAVYRAIERAYNRLS